MKSWLDKQPLGSKEAWIFQVGRLERRVDLRDVLHIELSGLSGHLGSVR